MHVVKIFRKKTIFHGMSLLSSTYCYILNYLTMGYWKITVAIFPSRQSVFPSELLKLPWQSPRIGNTRNFVISEYSDISKLSHQLYCRDHNVKNKQIKVDIPTTVYFQKVGFENKIAHKYTKDYEIYIDRFVFLFKLVSAGKCTSYR